MSRINLVDVSLRDGNQSIWGATGITTRMIEGVTPHLNDVGYKTVELASSTILATAVRYHKEDPFARLRAARDRMPGTQLGFLTTGKRFITFGRTPDAIFELAFELLARNGITKLWVIDPMHDMEGAKKSAAMAKKAGFEEVIGGLCYTTSPVHTDEYFTEKVAQLDGSPDIDGVYLKDPAGILTPERVQTLIPQVQNALSSVKLEEIHSHTTTGVSPITVLDAADLGVPTIHCAISPLANGGSHPEVRRLAANLHARGHETDIDLEAVERATDYMERQARLKNLPHGTPNEYDEAYYRHTIPGGVQSTTRRQLAEIQQPDLFDEVIEESVQVRKDLGWPIVMTPFAQYIVTQATLNVISGERYRQVSDEVIDLIRGDFGALPGEIDPELKDKALSTKRGQQPVSDGSELSRADLRHKFGETLSDEELLLRAVMPGEQVDAMREAEASSPASSLKRLLSAAGSSSGPRHISLSDGERRFELSQNGTGGER